VARPSCLHRVVCVHRSRFSIRGGYRHVWDGLIVGAHALEPIWIRARALQQSPSDMSGIRGTQTLPLVTRS
jgi:hypothetical protein